ncbi:MAG TPA: hypothetical protein VGJ91_13365 [Polyangiaceae bacterium]
MGSSKAKPRAAPVWLAWGALVACGARSGLPTGAVAADDAGIPADPCAAPRPQCVVPGLSCAAPQLTPPACDPVHGSWACPSGSVVYQRAPSDSVACLPFHHDPGLRQIDGWGLSSLSELPLPDGRCLWIASSVTLADGTRASNVALEPDVRSFGDCPEQSLSPPTPIVTLEGPSDPSLNIALYGAYLQQGVTRVFYRVFQDDFTELGSGIAHYDPVTGRVLVPSPRKPFPWGLDLDLGDAAFLGDDGFGYAFGCALPGPYLEEGCLLARLDASDTPSLFATSGSFLLGADAQQAASVTSSGTWLSSLLRAAGQLRHVYIAEYGSELQAHSADAVVGPWSNAARLASCALPPDPKAFCSGVVAHAALSDPTRPNELTVSYAIGTTGSGTGSPDDYWPRVARVTLP